MIATVISLKKDGAEQPQFYKLKIKYNGVGAPEATTVYGSELDIKEVLRDGGLPSVQIDALFAAVE